MDEIRYTKPRSRPRKERIRTEKLALAGLLLAIPVFVVIGVNNTESWLDMVFCFLLAYAAAYAIGAGVLERIEEDRDAAILENDFLRYQLVMFTTEVGLGRVEKETLQKLSRQFGPLGVEATSKLRQGKTLEVMNSYFFWRSVD